MSEREAGPPRPVPATEDVPQTAAQELIPGDAYMDGSYLVFTAQYHLRRGYCCNSGCRHCPYRDGEPAQDGPQGAV